MLRRRRRKSGAGSRARPVSSSGAAARGSRGRRGSSRREACHARRMRRARAEAKRYVRRRPRPATPRAPARRRTSRREARRRPRPLLPRRPTTATSCVPRERARRNSTADERCPASRCTPGAYRPAHYRRGCPRPRSHSRICRTRERPPLPANERFDGAVHAMHAEGMSVGAVAAATARSKSAVARALVL